MPVHLSHRNGKYCVVEPNGTVKKCYTSRDEALAYLRAINMHIKKTAKAEQSIRIKASELVEGEHTAPAIQIMSDGTAEGTVLWLHGVPIPCSSMSFYCNGGDYPHCSMSITTRDTDGNGLTVERSYNLRHTPTSPAEVKSNG